MMTSPSDVKPRPQKSLSFDESTKMLGMGWPRNITSAGGIYVQKDGKSNIADTQTATFEYDDFNAVWQHRSWGTPPDPDYPWALFIYGEKGTLKASTMRADFIPQGDGQPLHFECLYEREQYPEDVTEKDIELNAAPATRRHITGLQHAVDLAGTGLGIGAQRFLLDRGGDRAGPMHKRKQRRVRVEFT